MDESIRVFAPATVANVGCAFDVLGFALCRPGDEVTVRLSDKPGVRVISIEGDDGKLPLDPERNTAAVAVAALMRQLNCRQGAEIEVYKQMPLGSGLGSSAASAAAGVFAANALLGSPLAVRELLPFGMAAEKAACGYGHADNVAPALLGGFVLIRSYEPLDIIEIPSPSELHCTVVHPAIEVKTQDARKILRKEVLLKQAVIQWGNVAGLIAGLMRSDYGLIGRSMRDVIVEPERALLIPGFENVKRAAMEAGALGCSLSGSGPSVFALSQSRPQAELIGAAMQAAFGQLEIAAEVYVSEVNPHGPRIVSRHP
jgi:homoserine kinase